MRNKLRFTIFAALASVFMSAQAQAYVCSRVTDSSGRESGAALSWYTRALTFTLQSSGTTDIPGVDELQVLRDSFAVWETLSSSAPCSSADTGTDITFTETELSDSTYLGYNYLRPERNQNLIMFRDNEFHPELSQASDIIALTTTSFSQATGEIFDADIEFNSKHFAFVASAPSVQDTDLKNTAVHEIGHFLGLGHSSIASATMYFSAPSGETTKGSLDCDDVNAIVFKYPAGEDNGYCSGAAVANCGYCASPTSSDRRPTVTEKDSDDGLGGCQQTSGQSFVFSLVMGVMYAARLLRLRSYRRQRVATNV